MSGLFLAAAGAAFDTFRVHRVVADSPAAEAGLQEGDELAALDGRPGNGRWSRFASRSKSQAGRSG